MVLMIHYSTSKISIAILLASSTFLVASLDQMERMYIDL
jgi:hypothetical protein